MNPIAPDMAPEADGFWDGTRERRLVIQHCADCGHQWYPRSICVGCGGEPSWVDVAGRGTLHSFTVVHRRVVATEDAPRPSPSGDGAHPPASGGIHPGEDWYEPPYVIGLVELDEGPRMLTRLVGGDPACDAPVVVDWHPLDDGRHLPVFRIED